MWEKDVSAPETARVVGLRPSAAALIALMFIAAAFYFPWRLGTFNPDAPILSGLVYAAELLGFLGLCLHLFMTSRVTERAAPPPLEDVTVDIFVTTIDEPVFMLRRTLAAAKQVRLATRIVLLDDGRRPQMRQLAEDLGVDYLARPDNAHAKAGNLNYGLAHSNAQFVATFDADHAPAPDFLERTLGYFRAEHVALVQTPQDFFNLDSFQHRRHKKTNRIWTEQSLFFRVIQPGKDRWNAAFYCGSCAVLRRRALDRIGGFATGTVTEDIHTSIRLHKGGFESVYHNQTLAYGVAPSAFQPYQSQRIRWGEGAMQVWRAEGVLFTRGLTLPQRLCYLASIVTYFDAWQKALLFLLPAYVLLTGIMPLASFNWEFLGRFLPWFVLSFLASEELGRGYARTWTIEQYNFLRIPAFLRATSSILVPKREKRFNVTRKEGRHKSVKKQLALMALAPLALFASIPLGFARYLEEGHLPVGALVANAIWAALLGSIAFAAIRFAWSHGKDRRADYRFAAPLPFDVHLPSGGWGTLRSLDLTSDGVRLAAPMGLDFSVGRKLEAVLRLPNGPVKLTLRVRHRALVTEDALPKRMELGCAISWSELADQDRLNAMLFGPGLEQRLFELNEQWPTPLDVLLGEEETQPPRDVRRAWAPGSVECGEERFDVAAQPIDTTFDHWRVLSYQPLQENALMRLPSRNGGETSGLVRVRSSQTFPAAGATLQLSVVSLANAPTAPKTERKSEPWVLAGGVAAVATLFVVMATAASARGERALVIGGVEAGDTSSYAYAGVVAPLPGQEEYNGWAVRFLGDRLAYSYDQAGADVEAEGYGAEAAVMHRWSGAWGYANLSAGVRYRDTELSQPDPGNEAEGGKTDVAIQAEGRAHVTERVDVSAIASRGVDQENNFVRAGVDRDMGGWRLGLDATHVSGPRYSENRAGVTAEWRVQENASLQARAGATRNDDGEEGGYAGLGLALELN